MILIFDIFFWPAGQLSPAYSTVNLGPRAACLLTRPAGPIFYST